jgi:hypothetical protein
VPHIEDCIFQTGKLNKVYKMVEGMSLLCHEYVRLGLDNFHLLNISLGEGGIYIFTLKILKQTFLNCDLLLRAISKQRMMIYAPGRLGLQ